MFLLDFNRSFEDSDLFKLPAFAVGGRSVEEEYQILQNNVVLGSSKEL